jgi:Pentapeptide repeats (8 copies)
VCGQCHGATSPSLAGRNLAGLTLRCADLRNVDLSNADLSGADLSGSDLRGANLHGAKVKGANLHGAKIDEVYSQYFTGCRLKGYDGEPEWQAPQRPSPEGRFAVNGHPLRCPCCGGESFVVGTALLETRGLVFLDLGWLNNAASVLTCKGCSRIEWFRQLPQLR